MEPAGLRMEPAGLRMEPAGLRMEPAGLKIEPAGLRMEPAGLKMEPAGLRMEPAGLKMDPAGRGWPKRMRIAQSSDPRASGMRHHRCERRLFRLIATWGRALSGRGRMDLCLRWTLLFLGAAQALA
jgi:hypothetical protein